MIPIPLWFAKGSKQEKPLNQLLRLVSMEHFHGTSSKTLSGISWKPTRESILQQGTVCLRQHLLIVLLRLLVCLAHEMLPELKTSLLAQSLEQNLDEKALLERKPSFYMDFFPEQTRKTPLSDYNFCRVKSNISWKVTSWREHRLHENLFEAFQPKQNFIALGSRDPMKNADPANNADGDAFTVLATSLFTLGQAVPGALDCELVVADNLESC